MATMQDVARRANVALSTVSYAINGTRPISEETRRRVYAAMDELGYRPHALAQGLASRRSRILALLFPSAADRARERGYHLVLWSSEFHHAAELEHLIGQGLVDGVMLMEVHLDDLRVNYLREATIPFSMVGRCEELDSLVYVDIDFQQTIHAAVAHLAELGHTHIALVNQARNQFEAGYGPSVRVNKTFEQVISEAGLHGCSCFADPTPHGGYETLNTLLVENPQLTAIMSLNERIVPGLFRAIGERGWSVPDDLSLMLVVSSVRVAEMSNPRLTTLAPPAAELGRLGVDLLVGQLEDDALNDACALLPCRLVLGETTGAAPQWEQRLRQHTESSV
jgi:DNA-binding LacI/PurR family transcriptional regulator